MSERLYQAYADDYKIDVRIARFHNIYGPFGTFHGGREKAPAALCRKIIEAKPGGSVEILGDGEQTRSFLHISQCIEGVRRLMESDFKGPVNIGSDDFVSINDLAYHIRTYSKKDLKFTYKTVNAPVGVRGRTSDNKLITKELSWAPAYPIWQGIRELYDWIESQMADWKYIHERNPDTKEVRSRRID